MKQKRVQVEDSGSGKRVRVIWNRYIERASRPFASESMFRQRKVRTLIVIYPIFLTAGLLFIAAGLAVFGYTRDILIVAVSESVLLIGMMMLLSGKSKTAMVLLVGLLAFALSLTVFTSETHEPLKLYNLAVYCIISVLVAGLIGESVFFGIGVGVVSFIILTAYFLFFVVPGRQTPMKNTIDAFIAVMVLMGISALVVVALNSQMFGLIQELTRLNRNLDSKAETNSRQLEASQKRLIDAEKLSALGSLVAGMAHEVNTPLGSSITGNSHLRSVLENFRGINRRKEVNQADLEVLLDTCDSVSGLLEANLNRLKNLMGSFRMVAVEPTPGGPEVRNITNELNRIMRFFREQMEAKKGVSVVILGDPDLEFKICPDCFRHVFSQLLENSYLHAFPEERGTVTISYEVSGTDLAMRFQDDGIGLAPDSLKRIFEPFFTTGRGQGRPGLGLTIAYNAINKIGGEISVSSHPGQGITYQLQFPAEPKPANQVG